MEDMENFWATGRRRAWWVLGSRTENMLGIVVSSWMGLKAS
jgi:hypothetical protein